MIHANTPAKHPIESSHRTRPVVLLIMGSQRSGRVCPQIAQWIAQIGEACTDLAFEVVDLADWPLPVDDEPELPHRGSYRQPHTQAWSEKISAAAAVAFVSPQYNWGYPAPLKNAIDHLYGEWRGKPAAIITYGGHGGGKCAEQLRQVAAGLKMGMVATSPALTLSEDVIRHGAALDPETEFASSADSVKQAMAELVTQIASLSPA
ncbi:NAD(P)H-dependent oxidoreductase [Dyella jejuensis]|uniref:NAD(P)H-dependent oxidoreductase n=2 Tax=Dyella jejuensis TaxID=1432009 RepID=A0ABW8JPU5_9GAMM